MRSMFARASGYFVLSVALSVAAVAQSASPETVTANAPASATEGAAPGEAKRLHTIPEDGVEGAEISAPNKFVRELMAKRPNEDMVVCIAGCFSNRDRVVYAQPTELPPAPKPAPVAESAPVPKPSAAAKPAADTTKPTPATTVINAAPAAKPAAGDKSAAAAPGDKAEAAAPKPQLVPTMATPDVGKKGESPTATDSAPKAKAAPNTEE